MNYSNLKINLNSNRVEKQNKIEYTGIYNNKLE